MTEKSTPQATPQKDRKGLLARWIGGVFKDQAQMAASTRRTQMIQETRQVVESALRMRVEAGRRETFEEAVEKYGYTEKFLQEQLKNHKLVHLVLYGMGCVMILYAAHLTLSYSPLYGIGAFISSIVIFLTGYIHGFRAWQIQHRKMISFQEALRNPGTYLIV